jgi:hypothetical protein
VFTPCKACHQIGETAKNAVGPVLNGVIGRKVGTVDGYNYSPANKIRFNLGRGNLPQVHQRSECQGALNEDGVRGGQGSSEDYRLYRFPEANMTLWKENTVTRAVNWF